MGPRLHCIGIRPGRGYHLPQGEVYVQQIHQAGLRSSKGLRGSSSRYVGCTYSREQKKKKKKKAMKKKKHIRLASYHELRCSLNLNLHHTEDTHLFEIEKSILE